MSHRPSLSSLARRTCAGVCALLFAGAAGPAPHPAPPVPAVDAARLLDDITTLSSDEFEGRYPGTGGEERTVAFLIDALRRAGLRPGNPDGSYVQAVPMNGYKARPSLSLTSAAGTSTLRSPEEFVAVSYTDEPVTAVEGSELVFVGYGVVAPEYGWDDYKGADLKGKTLVMLINDPPVPDPRHPGSLDPAMFGGKAMTYYGRWTYKYEMAAKLGAAGAIILHETEAAAYPYSVLRGLTQENFALRTAGPNADYPPFAAWMENATAERMLRSVGRSYAELKSMALSRDFHPLALGIRASYRVEKQIRAVDSRNVVGLIEGSDPKLRAETIVYSAHWDHMGRDPALPGTPHEQTFHGAIDNASGVASVLALARAFSAAPVRPRRSVLFLFTTAEEQGLLGARYYAQHPLYPLATTLADLNIDGNQAYGRTADVAIIGAGKSTLEELAAAAATAQGRVTRPDPAPERGGFYRADQLEFARHGVPVLFLHSGVDVIGKPAGYGEQKLDAFYAHDYHQVTDTVKPDWDLSGAVDNIALLYAVGSRLAAGAPYPTWKPGSEFRALREQAPPAR